MWMNRERTSRTGRRRFTVRLGLCVLGILAWTSPTLAQVDEDEPAAETHAAQEEPRAAHETDPTPQPREAIPPASDRAEERPGLPARLDTTNINLSGAELDYEVVNDQLILKGNQADLDLIEALINVLEETRKEKELRVVKVTEKDANEIARTVEQTLRDMLYKPNQPQEDQVSVAAISSRIILVSALPDDIDFVVDLIAP